MERRKVTTLNIGEIVTIGNQQLEVKATYDGLPCRECVLRDCWHNKDYSALKAKHFALSCTDLIPLNAYFGNIEVRPKSDCRQ